MKKILNTFTFCFGTISFLIIIFHIFTTPYFFSTENYISNTILEWSNIMATLIYFFLGFSYPGMIVFDHWLFPKVIPVYNFLDFLPLYILHFLIYIVIGYYIDLIIKKLKSKYTGKSVN